MFYLQPQGMTLALTHDIEFLLLIVLLHVHFPLITPLPLIAPLPPLSPSVPLVSSHPPLVTLTLLQILRPPFQRAYCPLPRSLHHLI
jgi:hypothetical protein